MIKIVRNNNTVATRGWSLCRVPALARPMLVVLALLSANAVADTYLGFKLGAVLHSEVANQLKTAGAQFSTAYGYKGYGGELPIMKVDSYDIFNRYGSVKEAWLSFTPEKKLYNIAVTWSDTGSTFTTLKDALDSKYGSGVKSGRGFNHYYEYNDKDIIIVLDRNTFGFGPDQSTGLSYTYRTALPEVDRMKELIEADIRQKNASKAASDI